MEKFKNKNSSIVKVFSVFLALLCIEIILDGAYILKSSIYDDTGLLHYNNNISLIGAISSHGYKFRPISNGIIWLISRVCGGNIILYGRINIFLAAVTGTLIYVLIQREGKSDWMSGIASILYVSSRFSYYQITTQLGVMEWTCTTLTILMIFLLYKYICTGELKFYYWIVFCFALNALSHERFLVLFPVIIISWIFVQKDKHKLRNWFPPIITIIVFGTILSLMFFLVDNVMVGTSGTLVKETTTVSSVMHFFKQSIGYIFGINSDEIYLSMVSYAGYSKLMKILIWISIVMVAIIVVSALYNLIMNKERKNNILFISCLVLTIGALLFISSSTIRVELRWMYAPYMVAIVLLIYLVMEKSNVKILIYIKNTAIIVYTVIMICFGFYCRSFYYNLYYFKGYMDANSFIENTYEKYGVESFSKNWIVIADFDIGQSWKELLEQYDIDDKYDVQVELYKCIEEVNNNERFDDKIVLYYQNGEFIDITSLMPYIIN